MATATTSPAVPGGIALLAGRTVARIGFGAMQLAELPGRPAPGRGGALSVLRRAVGQGVNHLDTAQFYGAGTANQLIRAALSPYPGDLALVSKVGAEHTADGPRAPASRGRPRRSARAPARRGAATSRSPRCAGER